MAVKYKNTIGTEFPDYVTRQIESRKKIVEKTTRTNSDIQWLTNRTGWYRISSGALVDKKGDLAKQYILQGGTVTKGTDDGTVSLKEGFNNSYQRGPLGFKPMPGVTSLSVGTGGRWQTLLQGEVSFIAYDVDQLDILSKLFMSLGVHVFIEWGHKPFIVNDNIDLSNTIKPLNIFNYKGSKQRVALQQAVNKRKERLEGNYEALLGRVYNFDYKANNDGSYSCSIKVMGPGAMVDSLRTNTSQGKDYDPSPDPQPNKYTSDLANALTAIRNTLQVTIDPKIKDKKGELLGADDPTKTKTTLWGKISNFFAGSGQTNEFGDGYYTKPSYNQILNKIYSTTNYKGPIFTAGGDVIHENTYQKFGNAHQITAEIEANGGTYGLSNLTYDKFYKGYCSTLTYKKTGFFLPTEIKATYITLGHLFCLVQHLGILVEDSGEPQPAIYLDYHPDNTDVRVAPIVASLDPSICVVPFNQNLATLTSTLFPLDLSKEKPYEFVQGDTKSNREKDFTANSSLNVIKNIPNFTTGAFTASGGRGKLFNILVNVDYAIETLDGIAFNKEDRVATLKEYLDAILAGISRSLGNVNNFKLVFFDTSNTLVVVDENYIPPIKSTNYIKIPPLGKNSLVYDYSYSSKISKQLASQIVIGTMAEDKLAAFEKLGDDALSYQKLNGGVGDRFSDEFKPPVDNTKGKDIENLRQPQALFDQLYEVYSLSSEEPINKGVSESLLNYYSSLQKQQINKNIVEKNNLKGGVLIPLELSITLDGISGILPYNAFELPDNVLPRKYRKRVAFIVFSINHNFDNNKWTTTLRGQTIMKP